MTTKALVFDVIGHDRATATFDSVGKSIDRTSSKMDKFHKLGAAAGKVAAAGFLAAGAAAVVMTKKAAEDQLAAQKLATTLHTAAHATDAQVASTEDWITAQGKAYGVTDDDLRPALSRLAVATGSVSKAQKLASLAMNISAGTGKSLSQVSTALARAQTGNVSSLGRLGVATKNADGSTRSLQDVTKQLASTYKGASAASADTAAGKQKILTTQMSELQEQIGYKLIPVMLTLANVGLKVVDWISRNTKLVGILVAVLGTMVVTVWAVSAAIKAWTAITKVYAAAQWLMNAAMDANPIGLVVIAIAALVAGFIIAYKHSEKFRAIVDGAFSAIKRVVLGAINAVVGFVKSHWVLLVGIIGGPLALIAALVIKHFGQIKAFISNVMGAIKGVVTSLWNGTVNVIKTGADGIVNGIRALPGRIRGLVGAFGEAGHAIINAFVNGMKNAGGVIAGIAGNVWNALKSLIDGAIDRINAALNFTISIPGPDIHINAGQIPHLAKGGIVRRPTLALIGESGAEAVVPLSRGGGMGGGDIHITINGALDPIAVGKQVQQVLLKLKRTQGGKDLGIA
jgi:phage-related protein